MHELRCPSHETANFLIVDDDIVTIKSIQRAMNTLKIANPVLVANDGIEALDLLRQSIGDSRKLSPFIVTLDLNMPRMGGHQFLEEIRSDEVLRKLIVFVLTSSDAPEDIASAYEQNVAGYILKEDPTNSLRNALKLLEEYSKIVLVPT